MPSDLIYLPAIRSHPRRTPTVVRTEGLLTKRISFGKYRVWGSRFILPLSLTFLLLTVGPPSSKASRHVQKEQHSHDISQLDPCRCSNSGVRRQQLATGNVDATRYHFSHHLQEFGVEYPKTFSRRSGEIRGQNRSGMSSRSSA